MLHTLRALLHSLHYKLYLVCRHIVTAYLANVETIAGTGEAIVGQRDPSPTSPCPSRLD